MAPASERSSVVSERVAASAHAPCPRLTPWVASTCRIGGKLRDSRRPRQMAFPLGQACSRRLSRPAVRRRVPLRGRRRRLTMDYLTGLKAEAERRFGPTRAEALKQAIEDTARWMAEVAAFPVDHEEPPAFYVEPQS